MRRGNRKGRKAPRGCYWRGNTLWARIYINGREIRRSLDTADEADAKKRRAEIKRRLLAVKHGDARFTFEEVYAGWEEWIPHQVGPRTVKAYINALIQLVPFVAGKYLDEINGALIAEIVKARRKQGVTNATIKRNLVALSSVCNFAMDEGHWEENPVLPRLQRIKERRDPIILPRLEDVAMVIARAPGLFAKMIVAARATGARQEELAGAKHSSLDRKAKRLTVIGKGNKLRVIDLEPFGGAALFDSLPEGIANAPLFWHGKGQRYENVASRFALFVREIVEANPDFIRFRFHDLRHLHAVEWLRSGRSIYDLQHRLGHSSIKTTEVYLKYLTPEEQLRAKGLLPSEAETRTKSGTATSGEDEGSN
jgi:integrase/recombinase XerD